MDIAGLLVFAGVYFVAVASPGPGMALVVARSIAKGLDGLPAFVAGFVLGDLILFALAASGLAFVAQTFGGLFAAIKYAGAAYLLFLAVKIWRAPVHDAEVPAAALRESGGRAFLSSLSLTLGNPKPIVFFLSIMPLVVDMTRIGPLAFVEIGLVMICVFTPVLVGAAILADRTRRLFRSPRAMRRMNQGTSAVMAGAAIAIATR